MRIPRILAGVLAFAFAVAAAPACADQGLLAQVKSRGTLRVALEGTYPPFDYQDASGKLVGFEVDLADAIATRLGVKPEFVPTKWDGILAGLDSGRYDVIMNQSGDDHARAGQEIRLLGAVHGLGHPDHRRARARRRRSPSPRISPARRSGWV